MTADKSARGTAVALLDAVLGDGRMLSQIGLPEVLSGAERARAERLAHDVLRHLDRVDRVLKPLLRKQPPLTVLNILRLAVVELSQGAAAYGVVNEAVRLARAGKKTQHLSGLVNAVLRAVPQPATLETLPDPMLPRWLRQPLVHTYGRDVVQAIEAAHATTPPIDITLKPSAIRKPEGQILPNGSLRLIQPGQISALPGYETGEWWVQDAAASMAVQILAPQPGEVVLDLCAAPGGKTLQLAASGANVTALDVSEQRLVRLHENLARTKLAAEVITADAMTWEPTERFDAILLDAPCSATGTIRRHPDLPYTKDGSELATLVPLQAALIDRALGWLKPGGRLLYCTCSLLPEEGELQCDAALARHPDLKVIPPIATGLSPDWITPAGAVRLRPDYWSDIGGMDGFFMAQFRKGAAI